MRPLFQDDCWCNRECISLRGTFDGNAYRTSTASIHVSTNENKHIYSNKYIINLSLPPSHQITSYHIQQRWQTKTHRIKYNVGTFKFSSCGKTKPAYPVNQLLHIYIILWKLRWYFVTLGWFIKTTYWQIKLKLPEISNVRLLSTFIAVAFATSHDGGIYTYTTSRWSYGPVRFAYHRCGCFTRAFHGCPKIDKDSCV